MPEDGVVNRHDRGVSFLLGLAAMAVAWTVYEVEPYPLLLILGAAVSGAYETHLFLRRSPEVG